VIADVIHGWCLLVAQWVSRAVAEQQTAGCAWIARVSRCSLQILQAGTLAPASCLAAQKHGISKHQGGDVRDVLSEGLLQSLYAAGAPPVTAPPPATARG
jgi:hypothetical protein